MPPIAAMTASPCFVPRHRTARSRSNRILSSRGRTPRYLAVDATGRWLVAANCDSDSLAVFEIDQLTGRLTPTGQVAEVPRPYGLAFVPKP